MVVEKLLPCRPPAPFWRWFNPMPSQNIGNRIVRQQMSEIGKGSLNPAITPVSIFLCHSSDQRRDFRCGSWPSGSAMRAAIVFLGNQFSMPGQQCLRSHDGRYLSQDLPPQFRCLRRKSAALSITEPQSVIADLFSQHSIFFHQIVDDVMLMLVHPPRNGSDQK